MPKMEAGTLTPFMPTVNDMGVQHICVETDAASLVKVAPEDDEYRLSAMRGVIVTK